MSGILFLGNDDFTVRQGEKGALLSLTYESPGLTLVLFYSKECKYCDSLINKFKQLPQHIHGCNFAMVNINRNMQVVEKAKSTICNITYVPDIILFVDGNPFVRYDGNHEIMNIRDFIIEIYKKLQKTSFSPPNQQQQQQPHSMTPPPSLPPQETIPAYTIGKPIIGNRNEQRVCYVNYQDAYIKAQ